MPEDQINSVTKLYCKYCSVEREIEIRISGKAHTAYCTHCCNYLKNISYDVPRLYIGKYKGKAIEDIDDKQYLMWFILNINNIKPAQKEAIEKQLQKLKSE